MPREPRSEEEAWLRYNMGREALPEAIFLRPPEHYAGDVETAQRDAVEAAARLVEAFAASIAPAEEEFFRRIATDIRFLVHREDEDAGGSVASGFATAGGQYDRYPPAPAIDDLAEQAAQWRERWGEAVEALDQIANHSKSAVLMRLKARAVLAAHGVSDPPAHKGTVR